MRKIGKLICSLVTFSMGVCAYVSLANRAIEEVKAKVQDEDVINSEYLTSVSDGDYVVFGSSSSNCATGTSSNWVTLSTTKTSWLKFVIEGNSSAFYLKDVDSSKYIYSSADKKVELSSTDKTQLVLGDDGSVGNSTIGKYYLNTGKLRPYTSSQSGGLAHLYGLSSASISSISIKTPPTKTSYKEGEVFDSTGLVLTATYSDSSTKDITSGYTWSPTGSLSSSNTSITITYQSKTVTQTITVATISSLTYEGTPSCTQYNDGEFFNPNGIIIYANYTNGDKVDVTSNVVWNKLTKGDTTATGTYGGKEIIINGLTVLASAIYSKLTSADNLNVGDKVIFVNEAASVAAGAYDDTNSNKYFKTVSVNIDENTTTPSSNVSIFTVGGSSGAWTFTSSEGQLGVSSTSNGKVSIDGTNGTWNVSINSSGTTSIKNSKLTTVFFTYNKTSPRFTTYTSSMDGVQIYTKSSGTTEGAITGIALSPSDEQAISVGGNVNLTASLSGVGSFDNTVEWSASDNTIVSLSSQETLSGNAITITGSKPGATTVTATAKNDSGKRANIKITVVDPNSVDSISLNKSIVGFTLLPTCDSVTLTATALPKGCSQDITWSSSNSEIAAVKDGVVSAGTKAGVATIKATSSVKSSVFAECTVVVFTKKGQVNTPIQVSDAINAIKNNYFPTDTYDSSEYEQIYVQGIVQSITSSWNSSNISVVLEDLNNSSKTISVNNLTMDDSISGSSIAIGSKLTAHVISSGYTLKSGTYYLSNASCSEVVAADTSIKGITIDGAKSVKVGSSIDLSVNYAPSYTTQTSLNWTSSDNSIATVSNGTVTGVKIGNVTITATSVANSSIKATWEIEVTAGDTLAGTYRLTSSTTEYTSAVDMSSISSYLNGWDSSVMACYSSTGVRFGCSPSTSDIYLGEDSSFNITLNDFDYSIAEIILEGTNAGSNIGYSVSCSDMEFDLTTTKRNVYLYPFSGCVYIQSTGKTFISAITLKVVKNSDKDALVDIYGKGFLNVTNDDCAKLDVTKDTWDNLSKAFDNLSACNEDAAIEVMYANANIAGSNIEKAMARYDYIYVKYATKGFDNFLARTINSNNLSITSGSNILLVVVVLSLITATSFVVIYRFKKKKEN